MEMASGALTISGVDIVGSGIGSTGVSGMIGCVKEANFSSFVPTFCFFGPVSTISKTLSPLPRSIEVGDREKEKKTAHVHTKKWSAIVNHRDFVNAFSALFFTFTVRLGRHFSNDNASINQ